MNFLQTQITAIKNALQAVQNALFGVAARGYLTVGTVVNNETIAVNGVTFTAKSASPSGAQFLIGATRSETAANFVAVLNASADTAINIATYDAIGNIIYIIFDTRGTAGNAFTLADSSSGNILRSAASLSGGDGSVVLPRVTSEASSATPTPNADTTDEYILTALAANATFGAPTGTPSQGQKLIIRILDNANARTLAFNAIYRAIGVTLPTTTTASKLIYIGCIFNSTSGVWDVVAVSEEL